MRSIRSRVLVLVLGLLGVSLTLISLKSYFDARHEIEELFDAQLAQHARLLAGMINRDLADPGMAHLQQALSAAAGAAQEGEEATRGGHAYEKKIGFLVFDANGRTLLRSAGMPEDTLGNLILTLPNGDHTPLLVEGAPFASLSARLPGYHDTLLEGRQWRMFMLHDQHDEQWILVGEREDVRGELVVKVALRSLLPDLVGLPLLAVLLGLAVGWSLRPLGRMVELLKARGPDNLSPLVLAPLPRELEPIVAALNRLLLQVTDLLEREKRFIANAAHELRTPLAVLRIHAENARHAPDPADRDNALQQLVSGVDRAARVVAQLLTMARIEPSAAQLGMSRVDLLAFVRNELAELIPLALAHRQELTLEAADGEDFACVADTSSMAILLQNLVSNAIQHTPDNGLIRVMLQAGPDSVELAVHDSGGGIPPALRDKVFERFFRQGSSQGAGLGLSIVARVVELHEGRIELGDSPLGGLVVRIRLPRTHR